MQLTPPGWAIDVGIGLGIVTVVVWGYVTNKDQVDASLKSFAVRDASVVSYRGLDGAITFGRARAQARPATQDFAWPMASDQVETRRRELCAGIGIAQIAARAAVGTIEVCEAAPNVVFVSPITIPNGASLTGLTVLNFSPANMTVSYGAVTRPIPLGPSNHPYVFPGTQAVDLITFLSPIAVSNPVTIQR